jgi:RNA polymerase primary sigma factor
MIADLDMLAIAGLMKNQPAAPPELEDGSRKAGSARSPGTCPAPTLEGWPRVSPAGDAAIIPPGGSLADATGTEPLHRTAAALAGDDFLLRLYFQDALRQPRLTPAEETELGWRASFDDDVARERLVLGSLGLVVRIACHYRGLGLPLSDLISEGNLGLIHATNRYQPGRGGRFSGYAVWWVRQRIRRALTNQAWPMRLPADFTWQHRQVREATARLSAGGRDEPDDAAVAAECDLRTATVHRLRHRGLPSCVSLHSPVAGEEDGQVLGDTLPDEQTPPPDEALARQSDREFVEHLLATLKPREQRVLRLRFGFDDGRERTLEEVGRTMGYVRQGIHKLETMALTRLRQRVRRTYSVGGCLPPHPGPLPWGEGAPFTVLKHAHRSVMAPTLDHLFPPRGRGLG